MLVVFVLAGGAAPALSAVVGNDGAITVPNPGNLLPLPAPSVGQPLFGHVRGRIPYFFNDNASDYMTPIMPAALGAAAGSYGLRQGVYWPSLEPTGQNDWNWSSTDALYTADIAAGQRPMWIILDTPRALLSPGDQKLCPAAAGRYCARLEPQDPGQAYELGYQLARRYPLAAAFEWRNESNLTYTQAMGATDFVEPPAYYAASLIEFARGVHAGESGHAGPRVLGGALANSWDDLPRYADAILAQGVGSYIDGLSVHLYDIIKRVSYNIVNLQQLSDVLNKYPEAKDMRLVNSEMGAPMADTGVGNYLFKDRAYGTGDPNDPSVSDRLLGSFRWFDEHAPWIPLASRVDAFSFYTLVPPNNYAASYGLFQYGGPFFEPTWAYCDMRRLMGGPGLPAIPFPFGDCQAPPDGAPSSLDY